MAYDLVDKYHSFYLHYNVPEEQQANLKEAAETSVYYYANNKGELLNKYGCRILRFTREHHDRLNKVDKETIFCAFEKLGKSKTSNENIIE